jgi:hypothetical protein
MGLTIHFSLVATQLHLRGQALILKKQSWKDQVICVTWHHFLFQVVCNQMQQKLGRGAALRAIATDFETGDNDVKLTIALDLAFQAIE